MKSLTFFFSVLPFLVTNLLLSTGAASGETHEDFVECLKRNIEYRDPYSIVKVLYTPNDPSYSTVLQSSIWNRRFNTSSTPKPLVIVTPVDASQIQASIACSKQHGMQLRVRSGGHDFEGLSYVAAADPFVVVDLRNLRSVTVDARKRKAWVQAGAIIGELYHAIANKTDTLGFAAGMCPTVGIGGLFSGGGFGMLMRKYGTAADNIVDAYLVDARGRILDRASMGEDVFWAIRGGGGNTFGVVVAWKVDLLPVPSTVTVFNVSRSLASENATELVHRWQHVAHKMSKDIIIRVSMKRTHADFFALYLGGVDSLLRLMKNGFPELGLARADCIKMSWAQSVLYFAGIPWNTPLDILLNRTQPSVLNVKGKSDFVQLPIPESGLQKIWKVIQDADPASDASLQFQPWGGRMYEISESSLPFPHRAGNIYHAEPLVFWDEDGSEAAQRNLGWIRRLHATLTPYVSNNPRASYAGYRDLDLGPNSPGQLPSYKQARIWGIKYFKNNFDKCESGSSSGRERTKVSASALAAEEIGPPVNSGSPLRRWWLGLNPSVVVSNSIGGGVQGKCSGVAPLLGGAWRGKQGGDNDWQRRWRRHLVAETKQNEGDSATTAADRVQLDRCRWSPAEATSVATLTSSGGLGGGGGLRQRPRQRRKEKEKKRKEEAEVASRGFTVAVVSGKKEEEDDGEGEGNRDDGCRGGRERIGKGRRK
ncbi:hypothetical protein Tsubulata_017459 [Turnera subulata]|uniref:FAD-binding PCMH-type domain-containing protein n=1 Tax=Turnera subulata TaxID=218843 RepID=A0A9Q0GGN5_9ROSI|nr:hypothetical protein Tsubulata_017459 [Turnera subulata]